MKKKYAIISMAVSIILFLILFIRYDTCKVITDSINLLIWIAILVNVFCIISAVLSGMKIYNAYVMYLVMFLIFIFGQIICRYFFGYTDSRLSYLQVVVKDEELKPAIILSTYCLLAMNYGAMLVNSLKKNKKIEVKEDKTKRLKTFAKILFICTIPFVVYEFGHNIILALNGGYKGVYSEVNYGVSSIIEKVIPYFYISLLLLLYSCRKNISKARAILIFTIIYSGAQMVLGARGILLLQILMAVILWCTAVKKPSKKLVIVMLILIIPVSYIISFIGEMRNYPVEEWGNKIAEGKVLEDNFILKTINEMGIAIYPTAASIIVVPKEIPYKYGTTFAAAVTTIIPNLGAEEHFANKYMNFTSEVANKFGTPFGGSIVEEGFVNFGWYCPLFFIFFAMGIVLLEDKIYYLSSKNEIIYPLYIAFVVQLLWTVRNNLAPLIIYIIRYIIPVVILYLIFIKIYGEKGKKSHNG